MSKRLKILVSLSLLFNALLLSMGAIVIYQKGGLSYLTNKAKSVSQESKASSYYLDRVSLFSEFPQKPNSIVFLGDSLTDRNEWQELFPRATIVNRGINNDTTQGVLNRVDNIIQTKPASIFLMVGTNDLEAGKSISEIATDYQKIVEKINAGSPETKMYIQSLLPINDKLLLSKRTNNNIMALNKQLETVAERTHGIYIDLFSNLESNNQLDPEYTNDGLHLNGAGYMVWKKEIGKFID